MAIMGKFRVGFAMLVLSVMGCGSSSSGANETNLANFTGNGWTGTNTSAVTCSTTTTTNAAFMVAFTSQGSGIAYTSTAGCTFDFKGVIRHGHALERSRHLQRHVEWHRRSNHIRGLHSDDIGWASCNRHDGRHHGVGNDELHIHGYRQRRSVKTKGRCDARVTRNTHRGAHEIVPGRRSRGCSCDPDGRAPGPQHGCEHTSTLGLLCRRYGNPR